jgi:HSP20 family protein
MDIRSLLPGPRSAWLRSSAEQDPLAGMQQDMGRALANMLTAVVLAPWSGVPLQALGAMGTEITETDKEITLVAEVPGFSPADVEVQLSDDMLVIRGEKKSDNAPKPGDKRDDYVVQRYQGAFARSIRLPFTPDPKQVDAELRNGLLIIRIAKPAAAREKVQRIDVRAGEDDTGAQAAQAERPPPARATKGSAGSGDHERTAH